LKIIDYFVQPGSSLEAEAEKRTDPYPVLLIQGEVNKCVLTVKIAAETMLIDAGLSVLEGLDRLFKLFWSFNIKYTPQCAPFFILLQTLVYKLNMVTFR